MQPSRMTRFWSKLILCVLVVMVLGASGGFVTVKSIPGWYASLTKPPGTPPNTVFGPVWSVLYLMIGVSLARVWHFVPGGTEKRRALIRFAIQLVLNLAWSPVFFGAHLIAPALVVIVTLWVMILLTILAFKPLDRTAAWLLAPYLGWVSYATYLNTGFLVVNAATGNP
ncbi:MAG: tryptophan-rich sensory protein [Verrucomicrobiae bacterium]|nr:tryptophan-rich sensory protein [Verrucomicrobiae bacterium]